MALWNYSPLTYKTRAIKPSQWNCKDQRHLFSYKCSGILTLGEVSGGNGGVRTRTGDACPVVLLPCLLTPLPPTPVSTYLCGPLACWMVAYTAFPYPFVLSCPPPQEWSCHFLSDLLPVLYYSTPVSCGPHLKLPEDGLSCSFLSISTHTYDIYGFNKFSLPSPPLPSPCSFG